MTLDNLIGYSIERLTGDEPLPARYNGVATQNGYTLSGRETFNPDRESWY